MALHKDNFFSLTKSERRATLLLLVIVLLLVGARVTQHYIHTRIQEQPVEEFHSFQSELKAFNDSLQVKDKSQSDKSNKTAKGKVKKVIPPKPLTPVPREE